MTTENIFGNNILNGDLTTSLVPELGQKDILIDVTPSETSLIDPITQELSLTEPEIVIDEIDIDNSTSPNDAFSLNSIPVANIDPLTAANPEEFQVNNVRESNALFTPPTNELQLQGGFGDYNGSNDLTFEVKNDDEVVVETYSLTGKGQATLYRDDEDGKAYIFFSGTDESTSVEISAKSNIQFNSYIGDSLEIKTTGSIDAGSVTLSNRDETGLILKSGVQGGDETLDVIGYDYEIVHTFSRNVDYGSVKVKGINNNGEVIYYQSGRSFIYSDGETKTIGSSIPTGVEGINDSGQVVGYTDFSDGRRAFLYSGESISNLGILPPDPREEHELGSRSIAEAINNNGQIVGWSHKSSIYDKGAFLSDGGSMSNINSELINAVGITRGSAFPSAINDFGQIVGEIRDDTGNFSIYKAFAYGGGQNLNLHDLLGEGIKASSGIDINNEGQVIGLFQYPRINYLSSRQPSFIYDDGNIEILNNLQLSDINNNGEAVGFGSIENDSIKGAILYDVNEGIGISLNKYFFNSENFALGSLQFINDHGQIVGYGSHDEASCICLLTPKFAEPELDDYINIGNVTTFGDTVLLQGNEITLTGNAITTNGGEIEIDGATTVNRNLTIDSSIVKDEVITDGGDITFTKTLDSDSTGTGSLRLQAGTGNILFGETVGGEATFKNINVQGADIVIATADITSDQLIRINATSDIVTQNITSDNGRIVLSSQEKSISTLDITSGSEEGDHIVLEAGDNVSTKNLLANELGTVRIASGKYSEQDSGVVGDITTESITGKRIRVESTGNFTATGDALAHDGNVVVDAKLGITLENVTADNGNIRLISEEKSVTAKDITSGSETEGGNIILESKEGVTTANLNARELGVVRITSGEIVENDTETLEDDTILVGDILTESITGKAVRAVGTGSFDATGDITAHDGRITVAVTNDVDTKNINSLAKSINLISTDGAVTVDGDLNSEKGGVAIHAANDISTQKIRSFDGAVALSSYDGEVIVEDDINAVRGGVTIAAKEGVEVARITTGIGFVNIGSGKSIVANGNISTNVGYVNIKAGGSLNLQGVTTNDGYVSLGADSNVEVQSLSTNSGVINLISATGSVAAGSINTEGSYVAIEAALGVIASAIDANGGGVDLIANSDFGGVGSIASVGVTDVGTEAVDSLSELISTQQEFISEVVNDLIYHRRDIGEFVIGVLYQTTVNNFEDAFNIGQFFLPLKLTERDQRNWTRIIESQSTAFQLGRELANAASIVQGIIEIFTGGAAVVGGSSLCVAGAGATLGASCFAAAPAIASGAALSAHGLSLIKNGIENDTDANLIDDLLAPQNMASTGGSNSASGLAKQFGLGRNNENKVKAGLEVLEPQEFIQFKNKIDGQGDDAKNLFRPLFDKSESIIKKVFGNYKAVNGDADAIADIQDTLSFNRKNRNDKKFLDDSQLEDAFTNANNFLDRYTGKVSGAFTNRFGRAAATGNTPGSLDLTPQDYNQALGEIKTAEDLLDGNTIVGNIDRLYGIPDKTTIPFRKNPEFTITQNGSNRLAEVKMPDGNIASGKNTFSNSIKNNLGSAVKQIINRSHFDNPSNKGYIRLDFRKSPDAVSKNRDWVFKKVKGRLENDFDVVVGDPSVPKINKKGTDVVEFVEVFYKDANTGGVQKLEIKVENGMVDLLN